MNIIDFKKIVAKSITDDFMLKFEKYSMDIIIKEFTGSEKTDETKCLIEKRLQELFKEFEKEYWGDK